MYLPLRPQMQFLLLAFNVSAGTALAQDGFDSLGASEDSVREFSEERSGTARSDDRSGEGGLLQRGIDSLDEDAVGAVQNLLDETGLNIDTDRVLRADSDSIFR